MIRNIIAYPLPHGWPHTAHETAEFLSRRQFQPCGPLYHDAKRVVIAERKPSISLVQRHLRIGYNRAARLIEQMEADGLVSAMRADGTREVLAA